MEERIEKLTQRAKAGDVEAFRCIWHLCKTNYFGEINLQLDEQQRWDKFKELKTKQNENLFEKYYSDWVIYSPKLLLCTMSIEDRFDYLERQVFEGESTWRNVFKLARYYAENSWGEEPLNIAFEDHV